MEKIPLLWIFILLCVSAGCKKSKTATTDPIIPMGITAKINGANWAAQYISHISTTGSANYIELSGYDSTGRSVMLRVNNFKNRGTYNIPNANDSAFYSTDYNTFATFLTATTGQVVIQSVTDSTVGGIFSYTAGSVTVTEGIFNVRYD